MYASASPFRSFTPGAASRLYQQVGVESGVLGASPHRLIGLLYDGLVESLQKARAAIEQRNFEAKGRAINRALAILEDGLKASLNLEAGGEIAERLQGLYTYLGRRLREAHVRNDSARLDECLRLLDPVRSAWATIGSQVDSGVPTPGTKVAA